MPSHRHAPRSRHRAQRSRSRRRAGTLLGALVLTVLVGASVVVVAPQLRDTSVATPTTAGPAALETAAFQTVEAPVVPEPEPEPVTAVAEQTPAVPDGSGAGRRIVFDQSDQRVWLVGSDDAVERTYLVSGSRFDNLQPGSYRVQSRTRNATAFDYSGTMEYFVQFTTGQNAPIGFHTVPRYTNGELEQTEDQLGTPLSAGCVRQWEPDAIALWDFAPIGTPVTVTA